MQAVRLAKGDVPRKVGVGPAKVSNGPQDGAAVRLVGVGDLILIEGPEKGLVA